MEVSDSFGSEPLKCYLKSIFFLGIAITNIYGALFSVRNELNIDNNLKLSGDFRFYAQDNHWRHFLKRVILKFSENKAHLKPISQRTKCRKRKFAINRIESRLIIVIWCM